MTSNRTMSIPFINRTQMDSIYQIMNDQYSISPLQSMEAAGKAFAALILKLFPLSQLKYKKMLVLTGTGGNGIGILIAAQHLLKRGINITVLTTRQPQELSPETVRQLEKLGDLHCRIIQGMPEFVMYEHFDLILDGILGCNISGEPYGWAKTFITIPKLIQVPVCSFDIPSGIDPDQGTIYSRFIEPYATMTLGFPKAAFTLPSTRDHLGRLFLANIGIPVQVISRFFPECDPNWFSHSDFVEL